ANRRESGSTCGSSPRHTPPASPPPACRPPPPHPRPPAQGAGACLPQRRCSAWPCGGTRAVRTRGEGNDRGPRRRPGRGRPCRRPGRSSPPRVLVPLEGLGLEQSRLVLGEELDALLRLFQILRAAAREGHAFLESLQRGLQRQLCPLELLHDVCRPHNAVLSLACGPTG